MPTIIRNIAKCTLCNDIIESKSVHDFRTCKCGKTFTDGGKDYIRQTIDNTQDLSVHSNSLLQCDKCDTTMTGQEWQNNKFKCICCNKDFSKSAFVPKFEIY